MRNLGSRHVVDGAAQLCLPAEIARGHGVFQNRAVIGHELRQLGSRQKGFLAVQTVDYIVGEQVQVGVVQQRHPPVALHNQTVIAQRRAGADILGHKRRLRHRVDDLQLYAVARLGVARQEQLHGIVRLAVLAKPVYAHILPEIPHKPERLVGYARNVPAADIQLGQPPRERHSQQIQRQQQCQQAYAAGVQAGASAPVPDARYRSFFHTGNTPFSGTAAARSQPPSCTGRTAAPKEAAAEHSHQTARTAWLAHSA